MDPRQVPAAETMSRADIADTGNGPGGEPGADQQGPLVPGSGDNSGAVAPGTAEKNGLFLPPISIRQLRDLARRDNF